jgi:hypothetical protein
MDMSKSEKSACFYYVFANHFFSEFLKTFQLNQYQSEILGFLNLIL